MTGPELIVNGRALARRVTGVQRYTAEILRCLGERVRIVRPGAEQNTRGVAGHAWEQFSLPRRVPAQSVLWSPANSGPLATRNQVLTLHDLSPLEHPEWFRPAYAAWYRLFLPLLVRRVRRILVPSEYVRRRTISHFHLSDDGVVVVPAGVDAFRFHKVAPPEAGVWGRYILFVGTLEPRKNLLTLLAAWKQIERFHPAVSLIVAGGSAQIFNPVRFPEAIDRVRFTGYVAEEALPGLYSGAEVFIFPSFDEGFGLPALEAMACETPVVVSTGGALPEVVGEGGIFIDPNNPAELAKALNDCLTNAGLRQSLVERGRQQARRFSWQVSSEKVFTILRESYGT